MLGQRTIFDSKTPCSLNVLLRTVVALRSWKRKKKKGLGKEEKEIVQKHLLMYSRTTLYFCPRHSNHSVFNTDETFAESLRI
jgi:hypothetical protein